MMTIFKYIIELKSERNRLGRLMEQNFDFTSYNNIKRLSENELTELWNKYLADKSNKQSRDSLIVQYIYLVRYAVGRIKVSLPATISVEDITIKSKRLSEISGILDEKEMRWLELSEKE